ncbi:NADH-quinone oxidoreductase subunit C [Emticicia sp. CRIBPO]|jgi:NADH-quinone oxidoreductase subunit C|uniref:NADH-quinone oxidoreductase subunit C n=1 Tax=Emticicia sp. CRIBPO TaxID=2683258 RepID=UPI0014135DF0|nr:NADH-quinone oxidoreductase subunit C [Emticicia sp. CRIBPO]NBA88248.1 NADH-quinone oxidoreductase subunit C [Emticicia sp. CRIBPO]
MVSNQEVVEDIVAHFGEKLFNLEEPYGLLTVTTQRENILEVISYLNDHEKFRFTFLTDITGIHIPDNKGAEFGVIYHMHSWENNVRIRIKVFLSENDINIPSMTGIFAGANWMERETFDFYGIIFTGHPNLKRILNIDEMDYFPMRKEYPLEDATREDKIDALFGR